MEKVPVRVRHDLVAVGEIAVVTLLIEDNLVRRQLSRLGQARAYVRLKELHQKYPRSGLTAGEKAELERQLETMLGMCGRNRARYLSVLRTPREVQDALENGNLKLDLAAKVATLPKARQDQVASAIETAIEADPEAKVNAIVGKSIAAHKPPHKATSAAYGKLVRSLDDALDALDGKADQIPNSDFGYAWHIDALEGAIPLIRQLLMRERQLKEERDEDVA